MRQIYTIYILLFFISTVSFAADTTYQHNITPDGSDVMSYQGADGTGIKQIKKPDGTIQTEVRDKNGDTAGVSIAPDGEVTTKTGK